MINLQRLKNIKDKNSNNSLRFVVDYILRKIQRDKSEFSRYSYEEDWLELDSYISSIKHRKSRQELDSIKRMMVDISDNDEEYVGYNSFEKTLIRHLDH